MTGYSEHGSSGLSREARRIWETPSAITVSVPHLEVAGVRPLPDGYAIDLVPERPKAPRCRRCQYRKDALGHQRNCGTP